MHSSSVSGLVYAMSLIQSIDGIMNNALSWRELGKPDVV